MQHKVTGMGRDGRKSRRWRWTIIGLVVLGVALFEFIEHFLIFKEDVIDEDFLRDTLFYGVVAFFATKAILNLLERMSLESHRLKLTYNISQKLKEQLTEAQDHQEASVIFIQSLRAYLTFSGAQMLLHNPSDGSFKRAASWPPHSAELPLPITQQGNENCSVSKDGYVPGRFKLTPCICTGEVRDQAWSFRYCCPLTVSGRLAAILYIYHSEAVYLSGEQEKFLSGMASEISTTLERIQLQESLDRHEISHANIQQRIARDMHATLGHNLAYLRMKLNQIPAEYQIGSESVLTDLLQLQVTANESYQQMRDLLVALTPENTPNLRSIMTKYAQRVADRAGFRLEIQYSGESRPLKPVILQQIILIMREALGNIEKHGQAHHVEINLVWGSEGLRIQIKDDGIGFDTSYPRSAEQLGIRFMHERAKEVKGELTLLSVLNSGTKISLWVPYQLES
jgi:signal transduction histidine kinase